MIMKNKQMKTKKNKKLMRAINELIIKVHKITGEEPESFHFHNPYDLNAHGGIKTLNR